jgi:hypothetical protein
MKQWSLTSTSIQSHMGEGWQTQFLIAFKDFTASKNWFRSEASINLEIRKRTIPSKEETRFSYFDGGTMQSYLYPSRFSANVYCRQSVTPETCKKDFDIAKDRQAFPLPNLVGGNAGEKGVENFSPRLAYVGTNKLGRSVKIHPSTYIDSVVMHRGLENGSSTSKTMSAYDPAADRQPGLYSGTLSIEER